MRVRAWAVPLGLGFALVFAVLAVRAQQAAAPQTPGAGRGAGKAPTAPPPIIWPSPPLSDGPITLDTGIQHQIRLFVTKGLNQPWSMAFLPDGSILIAERPGRLRIVRNGVLDPTPVAGLPQIQAQGLSGLMDLALHPRFAENKLIYFTYHKPVANSAGNNAGMITLARGRWDGAALVDVHDLFSAAQTGNASRIVFGKDGMVYMTVGIGDPPGAYRAQDPNDLAGKVLRLRDDGSVPPDNPFVGRAWRSSLRWRRRQCPGPGRAAGHRRHLGMRGRAQRRRRDQRPAARQELRLARGQLRPVLPRPARFRKAVAGRHGAAARFLGARHRHLRPYFLYWRQVP